jgi:hypothetical protein
MYASYHGVTQRIKQKPVSIFYLMSHFFSRQLHGNRIALHKNLFMSLLFNAVFEIWFKTGVLLTSYDDTDSASQTVLKQVNV